MSGRSVRSRIFPSEELLITKSKSLIRRVDDKGHRDSGYRGMQKEQLPRFGRMARNAGYELLTNWLITQKLEMRSISIPPMPLKKTVRQPTTLSRNCANGIKMPILAKVRLVGQCSMRTLALAGTPETSQLVRNLSFCNTHADSFG